MNVDMKRLFRDHSITIADAGDKRTTPGWLNIDCPHCGDRKKHLGWDLYNHKFHCWKCGGHRTDETLSELLGIGEHEAWLLMKTYAMRPGAGLVKPTAEIERPPTVAVPGGPLGTAHTKYLTGRGYNPAYLSAWGLTSTGHLGTYRFRIICPIWHNGVVVSFQGRDITGRSELRWMSCAKPNEARDHKHCLGGQQLVPGDGVAIVEGFTDAWRLGPGAVCTFGTDYLVEQVNLLRTYKRRVVVLDSAAKDPNAAVQADKLVGMLAAFPGETLIAELDEGDPGDLQQAEADYLMTKEWRIRK